MGAAAAMHVPKGIGLRGAATRGEGSHPPPGSSCLSPSVAEAAPGWGGASDANFYAAKELRLLGLAASNPPSVLPTPSSRAHPLSVGRRA